MIYTYIKTIQFQKGHDISFITMIYFQTIGFYTFLVHIVKIVLCKYRSSSQLYMCLKRFLVLEINFLEKWPTEILDLKNDFT